MTAIMKGSSIKKMSKEDLRRMQLIQVELLEEVDRICMKHGIHYSVEGGTLLGAIRHKGFIPWDDDVDIAMVRSEYEKFCAVCNKEMDKEKYFFQNHETDPEYRWGYAKVLKNGTSYIRYGQEHLKMKRGVYVEIFPMDGIPNGRITKALFNFSRVCCRKIMWSEVGKLRCETAGMRLWFGILNKVPINRVFQYLDYLAKKYDADKSDYVTCLSFNDCWVKGYRGFKPEYYINTKRAPFEGIYVNIPVKNKELLVTLYGEDYMQPPPLAERETHIPAADFKF